MATTTIRVPRELHERLARRAASEGTTLAGAIQHALDVEERADFWERAQATMGTPELLADARDLAGSLTDGLDPDERWDDVL